MVAFAWIVMSASIPDVILANKHEQRFLSLTEHTEISEGSETKTPAVMELDNQSSEDRFEA